MTAIAALAAAPRIERLALRATHVHGPGEQVHDHIAAAEDGDSYDNVEENFSQKPGTASYRLSGFL